MIFRGIFLYNETHRLEFRSGNRMFIREYRPSECKELTELFYNTVHTVNVKDYVKEQLDVWAAE